MIVAANEAWSKNTLNNLLFSDSPYSNAGNNFAKVVYVVRLSNKGEQLIEAWKEGSLKKLDSAFRNHELKWIL
jgi:hypothetical protein